MVISPDARVMIRPFASYRVLRDEESTGWTAALWGAVRWLLLVACFVSWTTSGRLLPEHLLLAPLSWFFAPALQSLWVIVALRAVSREPLPSAQLVALYFRGHAPWMLALLLVAGVCIFWPEPSTLLLSGIGWPALAALMVIAAGWSVLLTYALFRAACRLGRRRSLAGSLVFYTGYGGSLLAHYAVTGQLAPIFGWVS